MQAQTVVVFGGSSGIGAATAKMLRKAGARVIITGRDRSKLEQLAREQEGIVPAVVDATDEAAVGQFFAAQAAVDHVVICVSGGKGAGPFKELALADVREAFERKTLAQLIVAQAAARHLRPGGSITFVSAVSARSKLRGTAGLAAVNAAIEAVVPILALELAPVRVNAVSPGIVDTPWWDAMPSAAKADFFDHAAQSLPVGRVGAADEVASVISVLIQNGYVTGSVYEVDGGNHLTG